VGDAAGASSGEKVPLKNLDSRGDEGLLRKTTVNIDLNKGIVSEKCLRGKKLLPKKGACLVKWGDCPLVQLA